MDMDAHLVHAAREQWRKFLARSLSKRLDPEQFDSFALIHQARWPLPAVLVADLLLRPTTRNAYAPDMLVPQYLQRLLRRRIVTVTAVLCALYRHSTSHTQIAQHHGLGEAAADKGEQKGRETKTPKPTRWANSYSVEEIIYFGLTKAIRQEGALRSTKDALDVVRVVSKWTTLLSDVLANLATSDVMGIASTNLKLEIDTCASAFVLLLLGVCEDPVVLGVLSRPSLREARRQLSDALAKFVPYMPHQSGDMATRLEMFRTETLAGFEPVDKKKQKETEDANTQVYEVLDQTVGLDNFQVSEVPMENTRAGLYIYLNAALVGRPSIDDTALFSYLHNRYQGDLQIAAIHLILASFDVLANAVFRNEGPKSGQLLRSHLVNKVPLLLASFASSSSISGLPFNSELCISQALNQVDTHVFPTLSNMFDVSSTHSSFTESVRQEFFFACLLHGLVSESARDKILGDITFQELPSGGRYVKEALVQECLNSAERMKELIGEMEGMEGNAGAVCQALAEVLVQLCQHKDTMSLKQWCAQLARRPQSLDILMLFNRPEMILQPLCELLDTWRYDEHREDQGEYQLVYEEFSSILLLLLSLAYRYGLSAADLKIRSPDSFVGKLLSKTHHARHLDDLDEQAAARIGGWAHGLFDSDVSGLGDELMSSCSPQDFYLLIPTLFEQVVLSLGNGSLSEEMLKGGLEYLVEPFLLPSLIPAILFLCSHLWTDRANEQRAVIRILQLIILPNSISNEEASGMLSSVLNIVAVPLEGALRSHLKRDPGNQDVDPLLRALRAHTPASRRTGGADNNELESWSNGTLAQSVRHMMHNMASWCHQHNNAMNSNNGIPPSYTHRQLVAAVKMSGAKTVLSTMLDELRTQTDAGHGGIAYDVATALVCAPDVGNEDSSSAGTSGQMPMLDESGQVPAQAQRRISLRAALKREAERWKKMDHAAAEVVVRLYRRVEAQMVVQQMAIPQPGTMMDMQGVGVDVGQELAGMDMNVNAAELSDAIAAAGAGAGAGVGVGLSLDGTGMVGHDLGQSLGGGVDNSGSGAGGVGGGGLVGDLNGDDIFSGLGDVPGGFDMGSWGDGMDLG